MAGEWAGGCVHESVVDRCGDMNINVRDSAENVEYELVHPSFVTQCDTLLPGGHWVDNDGVFARTSEKANRLVD